MRVLRNGDPTVARPVVRFHCLTCDCEFEAERHEYTTHNDYRNGYYHQARCPCCGKEVAGGVLVKKYFNKGE
jgi:hypothetical protein